MMSSVGPLFFLIIFTLLIIVADASKEGSGEEDSESNFSDESDIITLLRSEDLDMLEIKDVRGDSIEPDAD